MRIAIFTDTFFPLINGVAYTAYQSAEYLVEMGHEVIVVTAMDSENKKVLKQNKKFEVVFSSSMPLGFYPKERMALPFDPIVFKKLKKFKPDIIHSHTPFSVGWSAVLVAKTLHVPLVGTHHTFYDHYLKYVMLDHSVGKKLSWKYTVFYYNFCDLVLSPSQSLADELIKNGLKKPTQIFRNAIDTNFFEPIRPEIKKELKNKFGLGDFSIVYVGRLSYEKSVDVVLKAFALINKANPKISLLIGGDGPERKNLEELAKELKIENQTKFVGFVREQMWLEVFQSADVFMTASKSENMPLTIIEAMSAGLPVVAVGEKGVVEIVKDGESGFLSMADDIDDLAKNVLRLESDISLRGRMSTTARTLALKYSYEAIGKDLANIYSKLISGSTNSK